MRISKQNFVYAKKEEAQEAFINGELVVEGLDFFQKLFFWILEAIRDSKTKTKKRVAQLEKNNRELQNAVNELAARLNAEPFEFSEDKLEDLHLTAEAEAGEKNEEGDTIIEGEGDEQAQV